jgi:hypothetical protein
MIRKSFANFSEIKIKSRHNRRLIFIFLPINRKSLIIKDAKLIATLTLTAKIKGLTNGSSVRH